MAAERVAIALESGLQEDECRFRRGGAAENLAGVRDIVMNLLTNPEGRNKAQAIESGAEYRLSSQTYCGIRIFHALALYQNLIILRR